LWLQPKAGFSAFPDVSEYWLVPDVKSSGTYRAKLKKEEDEIPVPWRVIPKYSAAADKFLQSDVKLVTLVEDSTTRQLKEHIWLAVSNNATEANTFGALSDNWARLLYILFLVGSKHD